MCFPAFCLFYQFYVSYGSIDDRGGGQDRFHSELREEGGGAEPLIYVGMECKQSLTQIEVPIFSPVSFFCQNPEMNSPI